MSDVRLICRPTTAAPVPVLDEAQRRVVEHPGGPLLVLAGPGTGKTTTLVEAVVARVERGIPLESVLMLTFSRRAAGELRDRVTARLGRTVREPIARTLHSYAYGLLALENRASGLPAPRLLASSEQDVVVRELLAGRDLRRWPASLRPALSTVGFAAELRDFLMRAVERGLSGSALAALGRQERRPEWVAAGQFLTEYQQVYAMQDPGAYDPSELVRTALNALRSDPDLLRAERARRRHLFVDEYQDTDPAQADLLGLLASGAEEIVLVGDPDQAIYGFRGADDTALREVDARFGRGRPVPSVSLRTCRRSAASLVTATRRVADRLPGPAEHRRLLPAGPVDGGVDVRVFRTPGEEAAYLAATLRRGHLDGIPWRRMAVLVRSTAPVLGPLRRALAAAGVPLAVRGEEIPLAQQPGVATFLEVLRCVADPARLTEDVAERLLLSPIGRSDVVALRRLRRHLRATSGPDEPTMLAPLLLDGEHAALRLPDGVRRPVERVARVLAAGRRLGPSAGPEATLWAVWEASGLAGHWEAASVAGGSAAAAADRDLDAMVRLFDAAARYADRLPHERTSGFLAHISRQQLPGESSSSDPRRDAVSILTAHAAKGLEWDVVCVAAVQEGTWPDLRPRGTLLDTEMLLDLTAGRAGTGPGTAARLAEERRLFYVAVTRARRRLLVTAVAGEEDQPSRFLDELDPVGGDRAAARPLHGTSLPDLVAELRSVVCDPDEHPADREAAAAQLSRLAEAGVRGASPEQWWGLAPLSTTDAVADPAKPVPVSPSRLDAYARCELRAVLQDVGARDADAVSASLGSLIHEIAAEAPPGATREELEAVLERRWAGLDFAARWHGANERQRASEILAVLAEWLQASRRTLRLVDVERGFAVPVGDAMLAGRVDRLEEDGDGRLVVVDLKTSKTKVRQQDVPTHPQLAAYQLAVESGAFGDGRRSGGAQLVQLAAPGRSGPDQVQPPLADSDDPEWIAERIRTLAARLRGASFTATAGPDCGRCDLQACCPLTPSGRQVTSR